ncbi:Uncharacterized protein PECH_008855 [Penicillium ucsense]|uniref:Uncharacterized protein n=1 Tax=Penicillium ucsense TaxID=2839758 RepID=A0A8J8VYJ8_9EURO|nr:Uncharacterized protein PECM_008429 [Penicillium ucsense]KAF7733851.1 Uncharacterized protein PECH_008855 [Penicillium ucsense]
MDHISTLCALSTVGIAPSGFALGRVERTKSGLFRRQTFSYNHAAIPSESLPTSTPTRPKTSRSNRPVTAASDWSHFAAQVSEKLDGFPPDGLPGPDLPRASMSFSAARRRRRGQTMSNPPLRIPEETSAESSLTRESHSRRPSSSWLRRLSLASFQTETPSTTSPVTPSFNGSASPILPRPSSSRRMPNKLVKRSSSQHSNANPLFVNTSVSPASALRRPATSHQRSESQRLQSPLAVDFATRFPQSSPVDDLEAEDFDVHQQSDWKPYLVPRTEEVFDKMARRLSTATSPRSAGVQRIAFDTDALPALVLASTLTSESSPPPQEYQSVMPAPVFRNPFGAELTTVISHAEENITPPPSSAGPLHASIPATRKVNTSPQTCPPDSKEAVRKPSPLVKEADSRRVIVNTVTASGTPIPGRSRAGSLKRVKGRTFSIPRAEMLKLRSLVPSPPQPPSRRNITDPSVFRRPYPLSPPPLAVPVFGRDPLMAQRSVSQDYNVGMRAQRSLTSDAVAVSAWQHSARPDSYTYSSLRRLENRHSIAASVPSSTVIGSDDTRIFTSSDECETDTMTDYWDSIQTRGTGRGGLKGLHIESLFDKGGARLTNEEVATLEDLLPNGSFASRLHPDTPLFPNSLVPAVAQVHLNDDSWISDGGTENASMIGALPGEPNGPPLQSRRYGSRGLSGHNPSQFMLSEPDPGSPVAESFTSQKMNIFDWSEQGRLDRDSADTEVRPRTMQGKQSAINRGSRAACRKVPSSIHLRSQSVPVARELPVSESRQPSGKFGTWGLGSKGVSEDWDSDFEFEDGEEPTASNDSQSTEPETSTQGMMVPKAILERQASLRGQFGQVQELTLLVEELKRLRHQASGLNILSGSSSELWQEAEGIVHLATIDDEDEQHSPPGSPSSLTFSFDDSEYDGNRTHSKRTSDNSWPEDHDQPGTRAQTTPAKQRHDSHPDDSWQLGVPYGAQADESTPAYLVKNSPRSKSVLDILSPSRQSNDDSLAPSPRTQKLPFDTQSLRDLVIRAGVVTRALKDVIRKAEGVDSSPPTDFPADPPFRRIFDQPSHDDLADFELALAEMQ